MMKFFSRISAVIFLAGLSFALQASPINIEFTSEFYNFDNADMLSYSQSEYEKNQQYQSLNTDDRSAFALSTLRLNYSKRYLNSELFIKMRFEGFWGNDNIGENSKNTAIFFDALYTDVYFLQNSFIRIGRQEYELGDALRDYFFKDTIDGILLKYKSQAYGFPFDFSMLFDVTGIASRPENTYRFEHIQKDSEEIEDYNGDTLSSRFGVNASFWLFRGFFYYVRYAASTQGGTDISENGQTSVNKPDGDYLMMGGARLYYDFHRYGKIDLTYATASGCDFQYSTNKNYSGYAWSFNYKADAIEIGDFSDSFVNEVSALISAGSFSDGFCGMRADSFGDHVLDDYAGYTVAPFAGAYHFTDYAKVSGAETYEDKTVAKTFYMGSITTSIRPGFSLILGYAHILANDSQLGTLLMGKEVSASLVFKHTNSTFNVSCNYFMPGEYFKKKSELNPYVPAGKDPFYCVMASFTSNFTLLD